MVPLLWRDSRVLQVSNMVEMGERFSAEGIGEEVAGDSRSEISSSSSSSAEKLIPGNETIRRSMEEVPSSFRTRDTASRVWESRSEGWLEGR